MPNIRSAAKRMRSNLKKQNRNQSVLAELKTLHKKLVDLVETKTADAKTKATELISKLDKAVTHGIIPHGRADRKKARIAILLKKL